MASFYPTPLLFHHAGGFLLFSAGTRRVLGKNHPVSIPSALGTPHGSDDHQFMCQDEMRKTEFESTLPNGTSLGLIRSAYIRSKWMG